MPIPTNTSRPSLPYIPSQSLPNNTRYGILTTTQRPPTAEMLDAEFNALTDDVNTLAAAINSVQAGSIPGANDPLNANKVLKTDGANNLSWTYVTNAEIEANAVVEQKLAAQSVTTPKIGDAAVTTQKIAQNAVATNQIIDANVTTPKLADSAVIMQKLSDNAVTTQKLANQAVTQGQIANNAVGTNQLIDANVTTLKIADANITTAKIADNAIITAKLNNQAVTTPKISSAGSQLGDVLTANGAGAASFLANVGKVLQIVSYEDAAFVRNEYDAAASPINLVSFKTAPFLLRITPRKTNSKIILFYSINVGSGNNQYASITLCKNNLPFKVGQDDPSYKGVTHNIMSSLGRNYSDGQYGCYNFSNLFVDTGVLGTQIVYEIKKAQPYTGINSGYSGGYATVSTMHAIEIDI
jgi:hypothetical protein